MATKTFHEVLNMIQFSGLNYKMEISPFSATIHMKNSAVTDKNGNQLHKPQENRIHVSQIKEEKIRHARDIFNLETKVEGALSDCDKMNLQQQMKNFNL